jgi:hypothetical protein
VNLPAEEKKRLNSSSSSNDESKPEKPKLKKKRRSKKDTTDTTKKSLEKEDTAEQDDTKKSIQKNPAQSRIEHLKKLLRISGIRLIIKKTELDELSSNKAKIDYLKSFFDTAGFTGEISQQSVFIL